MKTAFVKAIALILSCDEVLVDILAKTARMSLMSSVAALLLGVPLGILLGAGRFPGRKVLVVVNRTLMGMPPVVCGLLFYVLFSGVGPFRHLNLMFTLPLMILAQIVLITPLVAGNMETFVSRIAGPVRETAQGLGLSRFATFRLLWAESRYQIVFAYLLAFSRSIAEVGAISMVGGAIAWKTNVMTTAIMQYTNRGDLTLGIALGVILMAIALLVNVTISLMQKGTGNDNTAD